MAFPRKMLYAYYDSNRNLDDMLLFKTKLKSSVISKECLKFHKFVIFCNVINHSYQSAFQEQSLIIFRLYTASRWWYFYPSIISRILPSAL